MKWLKRNFGAVFGSIAAGLILTAMLTMLLIICLSLFKLLIWLVGVWF